VIEDKQLNIICTGPG